LRRRSGGLKGSSFLTVFFKDEVVAAGLEAGLVPGVTSTENDVLSSSLHPHCLAVLSEVVELKVIEVLVGLVD